MLTEVKVNNQRNVERMNVCMQMLTNIAVFLLLPVRCRRVP